ncbi:hypothetical protein M0R45_035334 [Rubus argutus]|uniref:Uncharacterized protein n=1 Tax=Rubus argutus TaxID=59490 RepID=A0AAW1VY72_RUBAR
MSLVQWASHSGCLVEFLNTSVLNDVVKNEEVVATTSFVVSRSPRPPVWVAAWSYGIVSGIWESASSNN